MTGELRDLLARRAADVEIPLVDLDDLIEQGAGRVRRRRLGALTAVASVALVIGVSTVASVYSPDNSHRAHPSRPGTPTGTPNSTPTATSSGGPFAGSGRPLVYAAGGVIHLGDQAVDTGGTIESLDVTDDGVVFTTADGGIWFTDGTDTEQIGTTTGGTVDPGSNRWDWFGPRWWVTTGNTGSLVAWLERIGAGVTDLVVYDTRERGEAGRVAVRIHPGWRGDLDVVTDDAVYWSEQGAPGDDHYWLYRVGGALKEVSRKVWFAGMSAEPRQIVVRDGFGDGWGPIEETSTQRHDFPLASFTVSKGRVVPTSGGEKLFYSAPRGPMHDLDLTPTLPSGTNLWIAEWLDDDTFVLMDKKHDLYTCRTTASHCDLTVLGSSIHGTFVVPTFPS
jgi:hypothetical protein